MQHGGLIPTSPATDWRARRDVGRCTRRLAAPISGSSATWPDADRALTHLARAVDASMIVIGTRRPGSSGRVKRLLQGTLGRHLAHHQHRPVLMIPTSVVDWKIPLE